MRERGSRALARRLEGRDAMSAKSNQRRTSAAGRLAGALVVGVAFGALDTALTRVEFEHRPAELALFLQATLLWLAYALLACVPAWLFDRALGGLVADRSFAHPARVAVRLAAWTALPVFAHGVLDRYTALGGDLSALKSAWPWLQVAGVALAVLVVAYALGRALQRFRAGRTALAVLALSLACGVLFDVHEDDAADAEREAQPGRPNVLFLVWDTTRAQSLQLYGYPRETTPHLAALAQDALVFRNARSVSCYTLTSHVSMLTGVYPSHHGARMTRMRFNPSATPSVARAFREAGYRTGAFVGTDVLAAKTGVRYAFERYDDRVDPWVTYARGWAVLHDLQAAAAAFVPALRSNGLPHWFQDFQRPGGEVLARAKDWIDDGDPRPWFCFVNLYDAHWPYLPEPSARQRWVGAYDGIVDGYSKRGDRVVASKHAFDAADDIHLTELYDAELAELDARVDAFVAALDLGRTGLLVTSDHGEAFGEGGEYEHANILECQTRVPLLVRPHGGVAGRVIDAPVNGVDVAPTLLALAGLAPATPMTGRNLLGEPTGERDLLVEDRDHENPLYVKLALYHGRWKLVRLGLPPKEEWRLYDFGTDADEQRDLAAQQPAVVADLRERMKALRDTWKADDARDQRDLDQRANDALQGLGYTGQ